MENTQKYVYVIRSYDIDPKGYARLTSVANLLQETAYNHANELQLGYQHLKEKELAWILSRMRIIMYRYPVWDEHITIETWPHGIDSLFALRDFRIYDKAGEVIGESSTYWLMADLKTHRPVRIQPDFIQVETREDAVFSEGIEKVKLPDKLTAVIQRKVAYSDLDIVNHVNNVKYIEWCLDCLDPDWLFSRQVKDLSINYLGEAKAGDQLEILNCSDANVLNFTAKNLATGKECIRAKMVME